jgi:6-phosphogluconolactonase
MKTFALEKDKLSQEVAKWINEKSIEAINAKGSFVIAFSGGSLPQIVADGLLTLKPQPNYSEWVIIYADERLVPLEHSDSNHKLVQDFLLSKLTAKPKVITVNPSLIADPDAAAKDYEHQISGLSIDLALLGMGPDGHCCSLFPGHKLLNENSKLIASIVDSPKPPPQRITFTLPLVNACKHVAFVITGDGKKQVLKEVFEVGNEKKYPVQLVSPSSKSIWWFLDKAAAALLDKSVISSL